jgi:hypothetical protein
MFKIAKIRASQMVSRDEIVAYKSNMKAGFLSIFDKYLFLQAERPASAVAPMNLPRQRRSASRHLLYAIVM